MLNCRLTDIEYYLPEQVLGNDELAQRYPDWSAEKIFEKTGIKVRHVVKDGEFVSDLAVHAALKLMASGAVKPADIDALVLCTETPDFAMPATANIVHERLGLPRSCMSFDFNQGCSGFVYGLSIAGSLIHSGLCRGVLLITSETYSRWCHPMDKTTTTIFGDAAAAMFLTASDGAEQGIGPFVFGTNGKGFSQLTVPMSGAHGPIRPIAPAVLCGESTDASGNIRTPANLFMNGPEIFRFATEVVPSAVKDLLAQGGYSMEQIDHIVLHQANAFMLKHLQKLLRIPDEKMVYEMEDVGNTVSASIPIALKRLHDKGRIKRGDTALLVGFGLGYSWAGTVLRWHPR